MNEAMTDDWRNWGMIDESASWSCIAHVVDPSRDASPCLSNMMEKVGGDWSLVVEE
jgi:hypothetical protein